MFRVFAVDPATGVRVDGTQRDLDSVEEATRLALVLRARHGASAVLRGPQNPPRSHVVITVGVAPRLVA